MATARVEVVQPEPPPKKVVLELSEEEAATIFCFVAFTTGSGPGRKAADAIYYSLRSLFADRIETQPFAKDAVWSVSANLPKLK